MRALKYSEESFEITATPEGDTVLLRLTGDGGRDIASKVDEVLSALHDEVLRARLTTVEVDLLTLDFMNSSAFKVFVAWIAKVLKLSADDQYRILLLSNPKHFWQRRSLEALRTFAPHLVTIETHG